MNKFSTAVAQMSAERCCGVNAPKLNEISQKTWLQERNKFLANVSHNGATSHYDIIIVLNWFNRFMED